VAVADGVRQQLTDSVRSVGDGRVQEQKQVSGFQVCEWVPPCTWNL